MHRLVTPPAPRATSPPGWKPPGSTPPPGDVMAAKAGAALIALLATLPLTATLAPLTAAGGLPRARTC